MAVSTFRLRWLKLLGCVALCSTTFALQSPLLPNPELSSNYTIFHQDQGSVTHWMTRSDRRLPRRNHSVQVKYSTFDNYLLRDVANETYIHDWDQYLEFHHFNIFNASAASEQGFINIRDVDCSASNPFALHNAEVDFTTPSVIRSNDSTLLAANLSTVFDFIAVTWKPLGPTSERPYMTMNLWRIEGEEVTLVDSMATTWIRGVDGFFETSTFVPGDIWPGFGEGVNWIEIQGRTEDGAKLDFCLDNLVLLFYDES